MLTRWDPFREMLSLRNTMDRMLERSLESDQEGLMASTWAFPLDVTENDNEFIVKASVPGIKPEDIDITYTGNTLTIKGEVKEDQEFKENQYRLRERRFGTFSRSISLPTRVNADQIDAHYENGVLALTLPKAEDVRPKRIEIKSGESRRMIEGQFGERQQR